jgi:hypothetical protein
MRVCALVVRVAPVLFAVAPVWAQQNLPRAKSDTRNRTQTNNSVSASPVVGGLARVRDLFNAAAFKDCATEAQRALAPGSVYRPQDPASLDWLRTYFAACLTLGGDAAAGQRVFEEAIRNARNNHRALPRPNTLVFPGEVVNAYDQVYGRLEQEFRIADEQAARQAASQLKELKETEATERKRQNKLLELASQETLITKHRRWLSVVPFGVGQFQNRQPTLGWVLLSSELLALTGVVAGLAWELQLEAQSQSGVKGSELTARRNTARWTWNISLWSLLVLGTGGVVEAQVHFVPEFHDGVRRRPLPPELHPKPAQKAGSGWELLPLPLMAGGSVTGGALALGGRF